MFQSQTNTSSNPSPCSTASATTTAPTTPGATCTTSYPRWGAEPPGLACAHVSVGEGLTALSSRFRAFGSSVASTASSLRLSGRRPFCRALALNLAPPQMRREEGKCHGRLWAHCFWKNWEKLAQMAGEWSQPFLSPWSQNTDVPYQECTGSIWGTDKCLTLMNSSAVWTCCLSNSSMDSVSFLAKWFFINYFHQTMTVFWLAFFFSKFFPSYHFIYIPLKGLFGSGQILSNSLRRKQSSYCAWTSTSHVFLSLDTVFFFKTLRDSWRPGRNLCALFFFL